MSVEGTPVLEGGLVSDARVERDPAPEDNLLVRHREGDAEAFRALVQRYRAPVYGYLVRCGISEADRDDLFQEIFLRVHRGAKRYDAGRPLHPWIFTVVANAVRTHLRRRKAATGIFAEAPEREPRDARPDGEHVASARQSLANLEVALRGLAPLQREVLLLATVANVPQKDIAEALEIPVNTVKTHLRRARMRLIEALAGRQRRDEGTT
jgi:RNA polymerase sigma-70 factor (ECF subfamily)